MTLCLPRLAHPGVLRGEKWVMGLCFKISPLCLSLFLKDQQGGTRDAVFYYYFFCIYIYIGSELYFHRIDTDAKQLCAVFLQDRCGCGEEVQGISKATNIFLLMFRFEIPSHARKKTEMRGGVGGLLT